MASAKKSSSSRSRSTSGRRVAAKATPGANRPAKPAKHFAVCVRNEDYPASLELRKLYAVLDDKFASEHGLVRVVDESGEDYLFPSEYFVRVSLPQAVEKQLRKIA
jgi:hypothetical protein